MGRPLTPEEKAARRARKPRWTAEQKRQARLAREAAAVAVAAPPPPPPPPPVSRWHRTVARLTAWLVGT